MIKINSVTKPENDFQIRVQALKRSRFEFVGINKAKRGKEVAVHIVNPDGSISFSNRVLLVKGYSQTKFILALEKYLMKLPIETLKEAKSNKTSDINISIALDTFLKNLRKKKSPRILDFNTII